MYTVLLTAIHSQKDDPYHINSTIHLFTRINLFLEQIIIHYANRQWLK